MAKKQKNIIPSFRGIIDGSVLTKDFVMDQLVFILFLTALAILYIGNRYNAEKIFMQTSKLQKEIKELRSERITTQSELMKISKLSEVAKLVDSKNLGLHELVEPPKKIILK